MSVTSEDTVNYARFLVQVVPSDAIDILHKICELEDFERYVKLECTKMANGKVKRYTVKRLV